MCLREQRCQGVRRARKIRQLLLDRTRASWGVIMKTAMMVLIVLFLSAPVLADTVAWVTINKLNRRTCPSTSCGIIGQLEKKEQVTILEEKDDWARISIHYDAGCKNGFSLFVVEGNKKCSPENGIVDGMMAEWVSKQYVSGESPDIQSLVPLERYNLVKYSDDFELHKDIFAEVAQSLIDDGKCTYDDFNEVGGWISSPNYSNKPIYFIYCGGTQIGNQIHLDVSNGRVW